MHPSRSEIYRVWLRYAKRSVQWRMRVALGMERRDAPFPAHADADADGSELDRWGQAAETAYDSPSLGWLDADWIVKDYVWPLVFGDAPGTTWGQKAANAFRLPKGRWLSIGCGSGNLEIQMAERGLFDHMVAVDPSPRAVEAATQAAADRGLANLTFEVGDANQMTLPPATYDVVHANMSMHHVERLEFLAYQINRSLKPAGVLIANEFVGPNQFQFPQHQQEMVKEKLLQMPGRLRWNPHVEQVKNEYPVYPRKHWNDWDPTESIRSDEIPMILRRNFPRTRQLPYGGTILNLLLENIVQNFDLSLDEDRYWAENVMSYERDLLDKEAITSDFAYFVCPRGHLPARLRGWLAARIELRRRVTMSLRRRLLA